MKNNETEKILMRLNLKNFKNERDTKIESTSETIRKLETLEREVRYLKNNIEGNIETIKWYDKEISDLEKSIFDNALEYTNEEG